MASDFILFTCTLFFLQFLNIEVGNAQRYSYETPNMAGKFTRKELQMARPIIENAINIALNDAFKQSNTSNNTSECMNTVKNSTSSAFSYFDAAGKLPAGFSRGHTVWLGSFDTCQDIPDAHYCLLNFKIKINILPQVINKSIPLKLALCVPSVCGPVDLGEWRASNSTKCELSFLQ
ncbi:Hypothetical predicted protein [Paramuricea clavata]|uniref:Uncharacterized protein n=1 Tax=Paramuricea clavata TaxID=317549 RepID=A0A6S7I4I4_PARCT|nr:Hypothetical predicted protein [Paramuricea clavata]